MRLLLLLLVCLLPPVGFAADDFAQANQDFAAGKFAEARAGYERALAEGARANVFFNHGNACFRLDEPGRAALAYERALLLQPNHPEALANLAFVRGKAGARMDGTPAQERALRFTFQPVASWMIVGIAWAGFCFIAISFFRRPPGAFRWTGLFLLLVGVAAFIGLQMGRQEIAQVALVVAKSTDARTEPADRASLAEALPAGSRVRVLSEQGDWTYCELPGGGRGWVTAKSIERLVPAGKV